MKRIISLLLTAALLCALCSACSGKTQTANATPQQDPDAPCTLHVVTECSAGSRYITAGNSFLVNSIQNIIDYYRQSHSNVTVELEVLPETEEARSARLQALRTEIMAGKGPDLFLLPAGRLSGEDWWKMPPLFQNVEQAMRNGQFADLSVFYDADTELKTDELQQSIMDAGVVDGKRLVLPLGFDCSLFVGNGGKLDALGFDLTEAASHDLLSLYDAVLQTNDPTLAFGVSLIGNVTTKFSHIFDLEAESVNLSQEELVNYLKLRQKICVLKGDFMPNDNTDEVFGYCRALQDGDEDVKFAYGEESNFPMRGVSLANIPDALGLAKYENIDLVKEQARTTSGETFAEVTYWGAVSASSEVQSQAYELLRLFLTPEVQFQTGFGGDFTTRLKAQQRTIGWPVRVVGSVQAQWRVARGAASGDVAVELVKIDLTDDELPFLLEPFDEVRFSYNLGDENYLLVQELEFSNFPATDAQLEEAATKVLEELRYYLAES